MSDEESQLDEICVLQSIYTEEEFSSGKAEEFNHGQFFAYINLPKNFFITYKNFKEEKFVQLPISYLPPIILKFKLPNDYPSKTMPDYEISCIWLSVKKLNFLCKRLDELWTENNNTVILYTWTHFLKEESLDYLGIGQSLDLTRRYLGELRRNKVMNLNMQKQYGCANVKNDAELPCDESRTPSSVISPNSSEPQNVLRLKRMPGENLVGDASSRKQFYHNKPAFSRINKENAPFKDPRIIFHPLSNMFTHQYVKAFSEDRTKVQFLKNIYSCDICFQDKVGTKCIDFQPCNHIYCKDCIKEYIQTRISEGMVQTMPCPHDKCDSEASQSQIKDIIGVNLFKKYDDLLLSATLNMMDDITYCPRLKCGTPVVREIDDKMAVCTKCQFVFCVFCKMTYHGIEDCRINSDEKRAMVEEYEQGDRETKFRMEKRYGKKHLLGMIQSFKSENWISSNSKACPNCSANIEKSEGCNKMICWQCKKYFCWLCLNTLDPRAPYQHFLDPASSCHNQLFHGEVNIGEEMPHVQHVEFQVIADGELMEILEEELWNAENLAPLMERIHMRVREQEALGGDFQHIELNAEEQLNNYLAFGLFGEEDMGREEFGMRFQLEEALDRGNLREQEQTQP